MYRARAEAISGTRVYADGKWLQCIGNKKVSVGDRVWTDGRCVYGYERESQQPQVITAQQADEGIPIMMRSGTITINSMWWELSSFSLAKKKLKSVATILQEKNKVNLYINRANELIFSGEMPNTNKWTFFSRMINDTKRNIFLYDNGPHMHSNAPTVDTELIATNIDKDGNRFDMIVRFAKTQPEDWHEDPQIYETAVEILKNGEVVNTIDIQEIVNKVESDCPAAEPCYTPDSFNNYMTYLDYGISHGFIESEKKWCFWFSVSVAKITTYRDDGAQYEGQWPTTIGNFYAHNLLRLYLIKNDGQTIVSQVTARREWDIPPDSTWEESRVFTVSLEKTFNKIRNIPLQDDYYFSINDVFENETSKKYYDLMSIAQISFHSPNDEEIFSGIFIIPASFPFCFVKGKYLFAVKKSGEVHDAENLNVPLFNIAGLYLGRRNSVSNFIAEKIADGICLNDRLRPMKKIKGWQNRLQLIELEQHEI